MTAEFLPAAGHNIPLEVALQIEVSEESYTSDAMKERHSINCSVIPSTKNIYSNNDGALKRLYN
jgi:hypothetical protein